MVEEQYSSGRSVGFGVGDQPVIDERESVAEGFELLPHSDLLGGFEVIKAAGVDGCEEFGEVVVEVVEDLIGRRARFARRCWWSPRVACLYCIRRCVR